MSSELQDRVPKVLLDRWHVVKSRVRDLSEDKRKPNALWFHDLPNDVESAHLKQQWSRDRFDLFVFVSEWQRKAYEAVFGDVFKEKAGVLRNAIEPFARSRRTESDGTTIRLIYHTTPHRGLGLLVRAFVRAIVRARVARAVGRPNAGMALWVLGLASHFSHWPARRGRARAFAAAACVANAAAAIERIAFWL